MRGPEPGQRAMFSYVDLEQRVPTDHPLRAIQGLVEPVLRDLSPRFAALYAESGRPSIPPEQLLRALLLQVLYTIRSERQLMEQLDYNLLFRWFVGWAWMRRCGIPRPSPRTGIACWRGRSPRRSSRGCCGRRGAGLSSMSF